MYTEGMFGTQVWVGMCGANLFAPCLGTHGYAQRLWVRFGRVLANLLIFLISNAII